MGTIQRQHGFTKVEILAVIGIVVVTGALAALAVNAARVKERDAVRLSHVRQMQSVLENYFSETNAYPGGEGLPLGDAAVSACLGTGGFKADCAGARTIFLKIVAGTIPSGLTHQSTCGQPARDAFCYSVGTGGGSYAIQFELEGSVDQAGIASGLNCALPNGIKPGQCP